MIATLHEAYASLTSSALLTVSGLDEEALQRLLCRFFERQTRAQQPCWRVQDQTVSFAHTDEAERFAELLERQGYEVELTAR